MGSVKIRDELAYQIANFAGKYIASPEYAKGLMAFRIAGHRAMLSPDAILLTDEELKEDPQPLTVAEAWQRSKCVCKLCRRPWLP